VVLLQAMTAAVTQHEGGWAHWQHCTVLLHVQGGSSCWRSRSNSSSVGGGCRYTSGSDSTFSSVTAPLPGTEPYMRQALSSCSSRAAE
jgi:hypothetical protein